MKNCVTMCRVHSETRAFNMQSRIQYINVAVLSLAYTTATDINIKAAATWKHTAVITLPYTSAPAAAAGRHGNASVAEVDFISLYRVTYIT